MNHSDFEKCPVCGKSLMPLGVEPKWEEIDPEWIVEGEEDDDDPDFSDDSPVQFGWTMATPFQIGDMGFMRVAFSEQVYEPNTRVCSTHFLKTAIPEEVLKLAPWLGLIPQQVFVHAGIQGGAT